MSWMGEFARRFRMLIHRREFDADLKEEMRLHIELRQQEEFQSGMTADDAQAAARRRFGNPTYLREESHIAWGWEWLENVAQDIRFGLRMLRKNPGFTAVAVLTLALGIGANTAIFSVINAILLRPIPASHPEQLVRFYSSGAGIPSQRSFSYPNYEDLQKQNEAFSDLVALSQAPILLGNSGQYDQLLAEVVSENYFSALGLRTVYGRFFSAGEQRSGAGPVVVLSDALWRRRFAADPGLIGQSIDLNGSSFTVIGIAPPGYSGIMAGLGVDAWVPLRQAASWLAPDVLTNRSAAHVQIIARLEPKFSLSQAQAATAIRAQLLAEEYPDANRGRGVLLAPARYLDIGLRGAIASFLTVVLALVGLVLLSACANLTNLLLVRVVGRHREMAVRRALGASGPRLARQVLTESTLLALAGGAVGIFLGSWSANLINRFNPLPATIPLRFDLSLDYRVFAFGFLASLLTGVLLGTIPAMRVSHRNVILAVKEGPGNIDGGNSRARNLFVVVQVAVSIVLLVGAGLFLRSLGKARAINIGFDSANALALDVDLNLKRFSDERGVQFYREMLRRVESLPGIRSATLANLTPLDTATPFRDVLIPGHDPVPGTPGIRTSFNHVGPAYFKTIVIPLRSGRDFSELDDALRPGVVVINETMARRYWGSQNPIGKQIKMVRTGQVPMPLEIIGIANDVKYRSLGEDPTPHIYVPFFQDYSPDMTLLVRTAGEPGAALVAVQQELQNQDRDVQGFFARTLAQQIGFALVPARLAASLSAIFGSFALVLATLGIYGVVSYTARQRTREIGLRMALGAQRDDILRLVMAQAKKLALLGIAVGLAAALGLSRFLTGLLYGMSSFDAWAYCIVALLLLGVALVASYFPARRATQVDPVVALRYE